MITVITNLAYVVILTAIHPHVSQTTICLGNIFVIRAFVYGYVYHTHEP